MVPHLPYRRCRTCPQHRPRSIPIYHNHSVLQSLNQKKFQRSKKSWIEYLVYTFVTFILKMVRQLLALPVKQSNQSNKCTTAITCLERNRLLGIQNLILAPNALGVIPSSLECPMSFGETSASRQVTLLLSKWKRNLGKIGSGTGDGWKKRLNTIKTS